MSWRHDLSHLCTDLTEIWDFRFLPHTIVISRKTVKWAENTICDTCALIWQRYELFEVVAHTVVISRETVKRVENTIGDTFALNSRRFETFEVSASTVVIIPKTVKWAENRICDTCALNSRRYEIFKDLVHRVVISHWNGQMRWEHDLWYPCADLTEIWDYRSFSS